MNIQCNLNGKRRCGKKKFYKRLIPCDYTHAGRYECHTHTHTYIEIPRTFSSCSTCRDQKHCFELSRLFNLEFSSLTICTAHHYARFTVTCYKNHKDRKQLSLPLLKHLNMTFKHNRYNYSTCRNLINIELYNRKLLFDRKQLIRPNGIFIPILYQWICQCFIIISFVKRNGNQKSCCRRDITTL